MSAPGVPPAQGERYASSSAAAATGGQASGEGDADTSAPAAERMPDPPAAGRMPDFFIIGHEKCGTTALYKMLRRHPQIFMPDRKEPRFFSSDLRSAAATQNPGKGQLRTLEEYLALFAPAAPGQLAGEASPQYIRSPGAAARIAEVQPDARIIAILREPASFLRSFHLQCVQAGRESQKDLRKALALEPLRREGKKIPREFTSPAWVLYSEHVRYVEQLRRFHAQFPAERVLVLIYEDYLRDNEATLRSVLRFLEVDDTTPIEPIQTYQTNVAVRFTPMHPLSRKLRLARHRPELAGPVARTVTSLAPKSLRVLWRRVAYTAPVPPDERLMLELRQRFKPEVQALSDYLERDLVSLWGYDGI
jgi:Sulfotransferase family